MERITSEVIYERADADKPFMGLTTFKGDIPVLSDVVIAKNYLSEDELKVLNNLVSGYFDFAEIQAIRHNTMHMEDWKNEVENALKVFHYEVLEGKGKISHKQAVGAPIESACWLISLQPFAIRVLAASFSAASSYHEPVN